MQKQFLLASVIACAGTVAFAAPVVRNGSFEADGGYIIGVGYVSEGNTIQSWTYAGTGSFGRNKQGNAFFDNGVNPHGRNVALLQNEGTISQSVSGFEAGKTYDVSLSYNQRAADGTPASITVTLGGDVLVNAVSTAAVDAGGTFDTPFTQVSTTWTAPSDGAFDLEISNGESGGVTLLVDNIRIIEQGAPSPVLVNASFELPVRGSAEDFPSNYSGHSAGANQGRGEPFGWYQANDRGTPDPDNIVRFGVAPPGPFYNNGDIPNGAQTLFQQSATYSLSQTVAGFQGGQEYNVSMRVNARDSGTPPQARVILEIDGTVVLDSGIVAPVGTGNPFHLVEGTYTAAATGPLEVMIYNTDDTTGGSNVDDIRITEANAPPQVVAPAGPVDMGLTGESEALAASIVISNVGATDLNVSDLTFDLAEFTVTAPSPTAFVVAPLGSETIGVEFTSPALGPTTGTLTIESDDPVNGMLEIEFVATVVDVPTVVNPSFEADPLPPGPGQANSITGWDFTPPGLGLNDQDGPFYDNGQNPDGTQILFIQNGGRSISQRVAGWKDGDVYRISMALNSRQFNSPTEAIAIVELDGVALTGFPLSATFADAVNVYDTPWPVYTADVTITGDGSRVLYIENGQTAANSSLLVDDIRITRLGASHVVDWSLY